MMRAFPEGPGGHGAIGATENDRLKSGSGSRFLLAALGSLTIHILIIIIAPSWTAPRIARDLGAEFLRLEPMILVDEAFGSEDAGSGSLEFSVQPDPEPAGTDPIGVGDLPLTGLAGAEERLRGRLLGDPVAAALLAEPEVVPAGGEESASAESSAGPSLRDIGSGAALPDWLTVSRLELDRLTAVRPEIVVLAPSSSVLIRNPLEIDQYMRHMRDAGELDPGFEGWVQVAIWIDDRGSVDWAEVSRSSGDEAMDRIALDLFADVVSFRPAREGGVLVPVSVIFQLNFPFF